MKPLNPLQSLDLLLSDYSDSERSSYYSVKAVLEKGFTYKISGLVLSDKKAEFVPLNLIKPFFKLFHYSKITYYRAKYKKRHILTSLRGNLDMPTLFLEDKVLFKIIQNGKTLFEKESKVCDLLEESTFTLKDLQGELSFYIKLNDSSTRLKMEEELDSNLFLSKCFENNNFITSRFFSTKTKDKLSKYFEVLLNIPNFDLNNLSLEHLKTISSDTLVLQKIISGLQYGKVNVKETQDIIDYKEILKRVEELDSEVEFKDNQVILNYIGGK